MNIGVDDLFIQKIVRTDNVSVVMNPNATVRQIQYGGLGWWYGVSKYFGHAFRYYPAKARRAVPQRTLQSVPVFRDNGGGGGVAALSDGSRFHCCPLC